MRLHRFFGNFDFRKEHISISDHELVAQWRDVLRFEIGSELMLCDGNLNEALARINSFGKNSVTVEILGTSRNDREPARSITLHLSILKGEHFEFASEKATELGVSRIVPIISERAIKRNIREDRIRKIIKEAAEQSGRGIIPKLNEPLPLLTALRQAAANDINLFFDSGGEEVKRFIGTRFDSAGIFIGPEGGWTESEIGLAKKSGFKIASFGKLTLRAETAAIVAAYSVSGTF